MKHRVAAILLATLLLLAGRPPGVFAAAITVNTSADELNADGDCSLREAMTAANTNTAVDACAAGSSLSLDTISFSGVSNIAVASPLPSVASAASAGPLLIDGGSAVTVSGSQVFDVAAGGDLTLQDLTVTNSLPISTAGELTVNATVSGAVAIDDDGTLRGPGVVGSTVDVGSGGTLSPGDGVGLLTTTGNVSFSFGSVFEVELNGTTAGSGHDQLTTTGPVSLGGASLTGAVGFADSIGDAFTIIASAGAISNQFQQGDSVVLSGRKFSITYNPNSVVLTRVKADTTTALGSSGSPSVFGETATFTATVSPAGGATGAPTGTVTFVVDGVDQAPVALVAGSADFNTAALAVGPHTLGARYNGDTLYNISTATSIPHQVDKAGTTTGVDQSISTSRYGQDVTLTAEVNVAAPGAGTPTGTVTFVIDSVAQPAAALVGDTATLIVSALTFSGLDVPGSPHSLSATYDGDANFAVSGSGDIAHTVIEADTTATIATTNSNAVYGEADITVTLAPVAPGAGLPTGTVTFHVDDGLTVTDYDVSVVAGVATLPPLPPGVYDIDADYPGDANYNGSSTGTLSQTVSKAQTSTLVSSNANPSVFGQAVITATVTADAPGAGTPTGSVTFHVDDGSTVTDYVRSLSGGSAQLGIVLPVDVYDISADYAGDDNFNSSSSNILNQVVNQASTTTGVASSANPSVFGQSVTFTATVAATAPGSGTPTGNVEFVVDGGAPVVRALSGGSATFVTSALSVGAHTVSVDYLGSANFAAGSGTLSGGQDVNKANTNTSVFSSSNPSLQGSSVTFTAVVAAAAPGTGIPTGTVTFSIDGVDQAPVALNAGGQATFSTSALTVGAHSVQVLYNGDANYNSSTSSELTQTVTNTATSVIASLNPSVSGQQVTFTATVTEGLAGTPTGTVTFSIDGVAQAPVAVNGSAQASINATLGAGNHTVVATYNGDATFTPSTSPPFNQTVNKANTTTSVSSSANPSTQGASVTFTATVAAVLPGVGTPSGSVTFVIDGINQAPAALNGAGQATLSTSSLAAGVHSVVAQYSGDANFNASISSTLSQTVNAAPTTATPTATPTGSATPVPTPAGGQASGTSGGTFNCAPWTLTIPAGAVPNNSTVLCQAYSAASAPAAPADRRFLSHMINLTITSSAGANLTSFNPALTLCYTYSDSDLAAAGGSTSNLVVISAPINGSWSDLPTTVNADTRQVCANTDHLTLFELAARVPTTAPATGAPHLALGWGLLLACLLAALGAWAWERRGGL